VNFHIQGHVTDLWKTYAITWTTYAITWTKYAVTWRT